MKVGYVGLGAMGRALAGHLVESHDLHVWDLNPQATEDFVARGGKAAGSLAEMGGCCEIVLLCLPKSANVREALFGEAGLVTTLAPASIIIDQTSGVPEQTRAFAQELGKHDIFLIDAPVAGGVPSALGGQITIMASGPQEAFERALPVLQAISPKVFQCSDQVGAGQAVKAINNLINSANRMTTLELVAVGRKLGLDTAAMTDTLNAGRGRSFVTNRLLPAIVAKQASADFALSLMVKDVDQAADLAMACNAPVPISDTARGMLGTALNILGGNPGLDDLIPFMETLMKTAFTGEARPVDRSDLAPMSAAKALALVSSAMAACNRMIMLENIRLMGRAGLPLADVAPAVINGSSGSAEAELLFGEIFGTAAVDDRTIGSLVDELTQLARIGAQLGVPLTMANQVRAQSLACANALGRDAPIAAMTAYFIERDPLA